MSKDLTIDQSRNLLGSINLLQRLVPALLEKHDLAYKFFWTIADPSKKMQGELLIESISSLFFKELFTVAKSNNQNIF